MRHWSIAMLLVLSTVITQELSFAESDTYSLTYYVIPTTSQDCVDPQLCITLSEFVQNVSTYTDASTNITLMLSQGDHILDQYTWMNVSHLSQFHMIGYKYFRARIVCMNPGTLVFSYIGKLSLEAVDFTYCGDLTEGHSVKVYNVDDASLIDCSFKNGFGLAILTVSNLYLENCSFISNGGTLAGGLCCIKCSVQFVGKTLFDHNWAEYGGGLHLYTANATFVGPVKFIKNYLGGIYARKSTIKFASNVQFTSNSATYGGGISIQEGIILFIGGSTEFISNIAGTSGGGIYSENSTIHFISTVPKQCCSEELLVFSCNTAVMYGGGLYAIDGSIIIFDRSVTFSNNLALALGGGVRLNESSIVMNNALFCNNTSGVGGGMYVTHSKVNVTCTAAFVGNTASHDGGGIFSRNSSMHFICMPSTSGSNCDEHYFTERGHNAFSCSSIACGNENLTKQLDVCFNFVLNKTDTAVGALHAVSSHAVLIGTSSFCNNEAKMRGGGIYLDTMSIVYFNSTSLFVGNTAFAGSAIYTIKSTVTLFGESEMSNNSALLYGGAIVMIDSNFQSHQFVKYYNNSAKYGGAIHTHFMNKIIFYDSLHFISNRATFGGALSLSRQSTLSLSLNSSIKFSYNYAQEFGGGIYIESDSFSCFTYTSQGADECFINVNYKPGLPCLSGNISSDGYDITPDPQIKLTFHDNIAETAGNVLYGGLNITSCLLSITLCSYLDEQNTDKQSFFSMISLFYISATEHSLSDISSEPTKLCVCSNGNKNCTKLIVHQDLFPGETFSVSLVAVGQLEGTVPATIHSQFASNSAAHFDLLENIQATNRDCTTLHYTVFSESNNEKITLYPEGLCQDFVINVTILVNLYPCPPGFELYTPSLVCICEKSLQAFTNSCDITKRTIDNSGDFWVGFDQESKGLILHSHCPLDYCKSTPVTFTINSTDTQCSNNRSGLICGACKNGFSLTLGTSHCLMCSNAFLFLIPVFALAGIGLVLLLFACKLTVASGTINGLIFYANIASVNQNIFIPPQHSSVLRVFIAWVNLDLGIETCLFDGMDRYVQVWLQFVFPIYLWILVGVIIKVSQHSSRIAQLFGCNPVSVLATLVLLSYAKLLRTVLVIFSLTFLEYPDNVRVPVWLYDGNIKYLSGKHIPLFLVALFTLLFLFVPYTLLLLLGQWLQTYSHNRFLFWVNNFRVKAILDAYHGPLSTSHRYWVGLLLVLRCCLFIVFALNALGNPAVNLLAITIATFYLAFIKMYINMVYRNWILDILEASFFLNIGTFTVATYYINMAGGNQLALASVSVGTAMVTFVMILLYHSYCQFTGSQVWQDVIRPAVARLRGRWQAQERREVEEEETELSMNDRPMVAPTTTFISLRESLLDSS